MALVKFCLRDTAGSPERARWLHLARSGSQSQRAIWFILPAHGACHIINKHNTRYVFEKEDREVIAIKGPLTELLKKHFKNHKRRR